MTTGLRSARAKLTHNAAQPISPVAGSKGFAITCDALNKDFFGRIGDHQSGSFTRATSSDKSHAALQNNSILYKTELWTSRQQLNNPGA